MSENWGQFNIGGVFTKRKSLCFLSTYLFILLIYTSDYIQNVFPPFLNKAKDSFEYITFSNKTFIISDCNTLFTNSSLLIL